uniref:uncharacterized protein C11orf24 n=1 Tax=Oncorhynchus gorbuscha TaxID=8017 RepID=UPI001EAF868D|nr:uncharacterized protein C11orf24 [Oncorhynchus gorbuscha]XP_046209794.1 uncharacterized protein C11orf24 [Oncorhynchus gorbuscha]
MTLHLLLVLSPVLGLLVLPCLSSHVASQFSIVASQTMTEQTHCSEACSLNMTCDHAVFWKEKSTCFFLTCPNCTNYSSISVADLIREQETDISVFKSDAINVTQSSSSVTPSESQHKNPTAHKLTVGNNANQTTQTSALNEAGSTSQHSDAGQAPTAGDSPDVLTASTMNAAPLPALKNDTATTLSETSHKSKVQSPVITTATSVKLESITVMTPPAITQIMTITESETTATTTMTTTTTTAMPSTTNTTTTQPTTTKTKIPTTATTIKMTALPSTTTPKTTTTADTPTDEEKKPSPTIPEAPNSQATSGNAMVPSTATAEVSTKRLDEDPNRAIIDVVAGEILTRQLVDTSALLAVLLFGLLFFLVTVILFLTQAYKSYRRKDYNQVDYLINGMYSDSGV